jgi:hypothetical protein
VRYIEKQCAYVYTQDFSSSQRFNKDHHNQSLEDDVHTVKFKLRIKEGDSIGERVGVGQEVGHILANAESLKEMKTYIQKVKTQFKIQLSIN